MIFTNVVDYIKVIVNEYLSPGNVVLIAGIPPKEMKGILEFISCNYVIIDKTKSTDETIVVDRYLPFEDHSIDLIFDFNNLIDFGNVLKKGGKKFCLV